MSKRKYPVRKKRRPPKTLVSPFRYPGAKGRRMDAICKLADLTMFSSSRYVEPFAGGGSSMLYLVSRYGIPLEVVMNDLDNAVYSFWKCMEDEQDKDVLVRLVDNATVSVGERIAQRSLMDSNSLVEAAFAGLFINRTSFSGVMRDEVGPIGGKGQKSKYGIGCRYNPTTIRRRMESIFKYLSMVIKAGSEDFEKVIKENDQEGVIIYCDPPYYEKGNQLYREGMEEKDHLRLRDCLKSLKNARFVLSYDDCKWVRREYGGFRIKGLDTIYSVSIEKKSRKGGKELVITR